MKYPKYPIEKSSGNDVYEFVSKGAKGAVDKVIQFTPTHVENTFNLGFGDREQVLDHDGNVKYCYNDSVRSNNGDTERVLATVAETVYAFTNIFPDRIIFFQGSDAARIRLYRMAISRHYEELSENFYIFGLVEKNGIFVRVPFRNNGNFVAFIVYRKIQQHEEN